MTRVRLEKQTTRKTGQTNGRMDEQTDGGSFATLSACPPVRSSVARRQLPVVRQLVSSQRKMRVKNEKNIKIDAFDEGR